MPRKNLRIKFAEAANEFERQLREVAGGIAALEGDLEVQRDVVNSCWHSWTLSKSVSA